MGMAASQARFLGLTARKTNTEYEGQQVNQQRTALANQSADLYNRLLSLEVPSPPDINNYYKTSYTYEMVEGSSTSECEIISGLGGASCIVQKTSDTSSYASDTGYAQKNGNFTYDFSNCAWYLNFNDTSQSERQLKLLNSAGSDPLKTTKENITEIMNNFYDNVIKDEKGEWLYSTGTEKGFIIGDYDEATETWSNLRELTFADIKEARDAAEEDPTLDKDAWADKLCFSENVTQTFGTTEDTALQRNRMYYFSDTLSDGSTLTKYVQSAYLKNKDNEGVDEKGVLVDPASASEPYTFTFDGIDELFYEKSSKVYSQLTYDNCEWVNDVSGRPTQFTGVNSLTGKTETHDLTISTEKDETAYQQAMNDYNYKKALYDKEVSDINAKTEAIQAQDRTLELRLKQLDTEQKALQNELEAVAKVIKTNVEKTFKTFAE